MPFPPLSFLKSVVYPVARGIGFICYRHFKRFLILRKYGAQKISKNVKKIVDEKDKSKHSIGQLAAYFGWAKWCCCHNFLIKIYTESKRASTDMGCFIYEKLFVNE